MGCRFLSKIAAAGCNLTHGLGGPDQMFNFNGVPTKYRASPLWSSLVSLDLSGNAISAVAGLPDSIVSVDFSHMVGRLKLAPGILSSMINGGVRANFRMTSIQSNELGELFGKAMLEFTEKWVVSGEGFSCRDLAHSTLDVSPQKFAPHVLCGCAPGYFGSGISCQPCTFNFFNPAMNQSKCQACPPTSTSANGSTKLQECQCATGHPYNGSSGLICACSEGEALLDGECVSCAKRHLQCKGRGNVASLARPDASYMRLRGNDTEVFQCIENASARCPGLAVGCLPGSLASRNHG